MVCRNLFNNTVLVGALAENSACAFLENQGLTLIEKNFIALNANGKQIGEVDLIMQDAESLVFIEVKKRSYDDYGNVLEMVNKQKQSRIICTAKRYLLEKEKYDKVYCRFDVIGISPDEENPHFQRIEWIKNAFEVQY